MSPRLTESDLRKLRRELHRRPEPSGDEKGTAARIAQVLTVLGVDEIRTGLGGHGVAAVLEGGAGDGPTVLLRSDMDALPIPDRTGKDWSSTVPGTGHMCGHDGHMTILTGVIDRLLGELDGLAGRIVALYQPAEEIAHGARAVLDDPAFRELEPDYVCALHNLPGFPTGAVILREGIFASASRGLILRLHGETSHAAHPEDARTPAPALAALIDGLTALPQLVTPLERAALVTVIHAELGEIAFGTTPGEAVVMATLRAHRDAEMERLGEAALRLAEGTARTWNLDWEHEWVEVFPACVNDAELTGLLAETAAGLELPVIRPAVPFPWSEDFGAFLQRYPGVLFGLGAGEEHPQLHSSRYDFPDELIEPGIGLFCGLVRRLLEVD